jgi:hypothetical protein
LIQKNNKPQLAWRSGVLPVQAIVQAKVAVLQLDNEIPFWGVL